MAAAPEAPASIAGGQDAQPISTAPAAAPAAVEAAEPAPSGTPSAPTPAAPVAASVPATEAEAPTAAPQETITAADAPPTAAAAVDLAADTADDQKADVAAPPAPSAAPGLNDGQRLFLIIAEAELNLVSALGPFLEALRKGNVLDNQGRKAADQLAARAHQLRQVLQPGVELMKAMAHA